MVGLCLAPSEAHPGLRGVRRAGFLIARRRSSLVEGLGQPAFGVDGRRRAGAGRGDGLAVDVVDDVTAGEDAVDVGTRRRVLHLEIAGVVELELAGEEL